MKSCLTESSKLFGACGHYIADSSGKVDTFTSTSYGGTFEGNLVLRNFITVLRKLSPTKFVKWKPFFWYSPGD